MKPKAKPQSKIPTTGKNTNQKSKDTSPDAMDVSVLKKNEFTLIIVGALVATVVVFFVFFWDSGGPEKKPVVLNQTPPGTGVDAAIEKRVAELEVSLARLAASGRTTQAGESLSKTTGVAELGQRVDRLETAMTLKMDALIKRIASAEKRIIQLKQASVRSASVATKTKSVSKPAQKAPVKTKPVQQTPKASMFHTVKKGETLWSISQKYETTVTAIRKLNKLSSGDKIYPGTNILVR
jgi:LysM repeat protein